MGFSYFYITKNKQIQKYNVPCELQLLIENQINSRFDIDDDNKPYKYSSKLSCGYYVSLLKNLYIPS